MTDGDQKAEKDEGVRGAEVLFFLFNVHNELVCMREKKNQHISMQHVSAFRSHEGILLQVRFLSLACQSLTV